MFAFGCSGGTTSQNQTKTYSLTVQVVDAGDNSPIEGVKVSIDGQSGTTDNSGKVEIKNLSSGTYTIKASKEGYSDNSLEVSITDSSKTVSISLSKQTLTKLTDLSKAKSYYYTLKVKEVSGKLQTNIEIYVDDFGNKEKLISYNPDGKVDMEIYVVGDKGLIKMGGGNNMSVDKDTAKGYIENIASIGQSFVSSFKDEYDNFVITPSGTLTVKVSKGTQNGYSTDSVEYTVNISGAQYTFAGWVINSGEYKGFLTRLLIENKTPNLKSDEIKTIEINVKDFGKSFDITL
ncbi:carboxypeptidase regulatory-like domain-containing protein [Caldisericum exile]|uniref:carboxypeptidase regulatory-like domain-containing protein n=1 Tax=Caldisericum exile TaxID=693075 RepID=UPI0038B3308C